MKCAISNCERPACLHFTVARQRKCVDYQHFCEDHATGFWQSVLGGDQVCPKVQAILEEMPFELELLVYNGDTGNSWIYLREVGGPQWLILRAGYHEVFTLHYLLAGKTFSWPLTHEVFLKVVKLLGGDITKTIFDDYSESNNRFLAKVQVHHGSHDALVDVEATDGLALGLASSSPIVVVPSVIAKCADATLLFEKAKQSFSFPRVPWQP